jgi:large subunit ribosomal protein L15
MRLKKRKKSTRMHGHGMGTHGGGARKKRKGSGHRGGIGMAGSGKRADQKKTLVLKLYGNNYFGKQGITSRASAKRINKVMNLEDIQKNLDSLMKKYGKNMKPLQDRPHFFPSISNGMSISPPTIKCIIFNIQISICQHRDEKDLKEPGGIKVVCS